MTLEANALGSQVEAPCMGQCRGDRPTTDGPARYGRTPDGKKGMYCSCCQEWLMRRSPEDLSKAIADMRMAPGVQPEGTTWLSCENCGYDHVSMERLLPT